jgi:ribose transport system permease protein
VRFGHSLAQIVEQYGLVFLLVVLTSAVTVAEPDFLSSESIKALLLEWAPVGIMAVAGTLVIISGGFDLSVGGMFALGAVIATGMSGHVTVPVAFGLAIGAGLAGGLGNGLLVTKAHVNPFIATLGTSQIFRGIALVATGALPFIDDSDAFGALGRGKVVGIPVPVFFLFAFLVVGEIVLSSTIYGRKIYAVGGNSEAAELSGIRVDVIKVSTYIISGGAAAFAGLMFASLIGQGTSDLGNLIEFDVFIAIILGGTALTGGVGTVWRTGVGLALLAVIQNGLDVLAVNPFYENVIKGGILVTAVAWDVYVTRRRARRVAS